jgi:hypothetical protein
MKFTLDTNCIIDFEEKRIGWQNIDAMIQKIARNGYSIAVLGISASEKRQNSLAPVGIDNFRNRVETIGLGGAAVLKPLGFWGVTYWDFCVWGGSDSIALHEKIADILFANSPYRYNKPDADEVYRRKHINQICDAQALWAHITYRRDVFVTGDNNFHSKAKKQALLKLGAQQIVTTIDAESMID